MKTCGKIIHGADYNPEQWCKTPEIWQKDIEYMKKSGCNTMTAGIFSWSALEPEEGVYDFGYSEREPPNVACPKISRGFKDCWQQNTKFEGRTA
jgi:beta-galactosidase GanA